MLVYAKTEAAGAGGAEGGLLSRDDRRAEAAPGDPLPQRQNSCATNMVACSGARCPVGTLQPSPLWSSLHIHLAASSGLTAGRTGPGRRRYG